MKKRPLATILLAEDDDGHARLLERDLEAAGVHNPLIRFRTGMEAWNFIFGKTDPCLEPGKPYILLLDIRMPFMNGIDLLRRVRADLRYRYIPTAMLTTTDDPKEIRRCHDLGCDNFLIKPVNAAELAELFNLPRLSVKQVPGGAPGPE
jgi:CheY-like chemotaxis protein